jgi:hypothetical protein
MYILEDFKNNSMIIDNLENKLRKEMERLELEYNIEEAKHNYNVSRNKVREYVEGIKLENPTHTFGDSEEAEEFDEIYSDPHSRIEIQECIPYDRMITKYVHTSHDKLVIYVEYKREIQDLNMYHDYVFLVERFEI